MESKEMALMNLLSGQQWREQTYDIEIETENRPMDTLGAEDGDGETYGESNIEIYNTIRKIPAQAEIKIAGRNISNLRYADDTTIMAESEEELKSLLMKVKEDGERVGLKLNTQKTQIMALGPFTSWQIDRETVVDFIFGGLQNHCRW